MLKNTKTAKEASSALGKLFAWIPLEPNAITISSVFLALFGLLAYESTLAGRVMSLLLFLLAFGFDALDGAVARAKGKITKQGAFIDGVADRIVEFFLILTMLKAFDAIPYNILYPDAGWALILILFFGTCMTSFVKAYAEHQGILDHEKALKLPGILERAERSILLLSAFALFVFGFAQYGVYVIYLTAALSVVTFAQRLLAVLSS